MKMKTEDNREITIPDDVMKPYLPKRTGYERVEHGRAYLYETILGNSTVDTEVGHNVDAKRFDVANYYTDEQLARDNARADTLMRRLRRYAAEHGGISSKKDWKARGGAQRWNICYNWPDKTLSSDFWFNCQQHGVIYFRTQADCESAMREFHDDLIWYFTQYEGQVRE